MTRHIDEVRVGEIMTRAPVVVRADTDLRRLKRLFATHDFNMFPVIDDRGAVMGVVSKLDFLRVFRPDRSRLRPDLRALWAERVGDIMRRSVLSVRADDPVETAMDLMVEWQLRSLPVVERQDGVGRLVGVVSRGDVLRCLMLDGDDPD